MLEEAKKRDHRKIGREMDLFMMREEARLPVLPAQRHDPQEHAARLLARDPPKAGYVEISTPLIMNSSCGRPRALGSLQGQHVLHRHRRRGVLHQAHELPGRRAGVRLQAALLRSCPSALARLAWCTATSCAAPCTACSACAASTRTTPTCSCVPTS